MSNSDRVLNVGASARASDVQAIADVAALADDRALEILVTPGATPKKVIPLSEETASLNPRLLVVGQDIDGGVANAKVRVRPCFYDAGVSGAPYTIGLSTSSKANQDSPAFGNNSSGSTRYDLLYATISYGTPTTVSVRQKPTAGTAPVSALLTVQNDMLITLGIVPNVASGNPLASLPADSGSGKAAVYNFGLAMVAIANGFSGGAINQASITPLWNGGWIQRQRIQNNLTASLYAGAANEKPTTPVTDRFGAFRKMFAHMKVLSTTPTSSASGVIVDNSIDWRRRLILAFITYMGSAGTSGANASLETANALNLAGANPTTIQKVFSGAGSAATLFNISYSGGAVNFSVDTSGVIRLFKSGTVPADGTNGDLVSIDLFYSDQFTAGM